MKEGMNDASKRKCGSGTVTKFDSPKKAAVQCLAVTPEGSPNRGHLSQRQIAIELQMSKGAVFNILKESGLKCYRRIKCHTLTEQHKQQREIKAAAMINWFEHNERWKFVWFYDEASFMLQAPLNRQNERIYRAVNLKTDIPDEDLLSEIDQQQPSIMCYAAVSWQGKTALRFIEGYAANQDNVP